MTFDRSLTTNYDIYFINEKNNDGTYSNIFLDDSSKKNSRMIYAKNGTLIDNENKKIFRLYNGKILNLEKSKVNAFEFEQIDFNLAEYSTNTILHPKIQELPTINLFKCAQQILNKNIVLEDRSLTCKPNIFNEIKQELFKRFYKPLYIPLIALLCCFLTVVSKNNVNYKRNKRIIFLITFFILVISEGSLRYSTISNSATTLYLAIPWLSFILIYIYFYLRIKNV